DLGVADIFYFARKQGAQFLADGGINASGAAVGDDALVIERAEIGARRDVAALEFHSQAERFDDPASHLEFQRVVSKQSQVAGAAARGDARRDGVHASLRRIFAEGV